MRRVVDSGTAVVRMVQLAVRRREPALVVREAAGGWRHTFSDGVLVMPTPRGAPWHQARRDTEDLFFHRYRPGAGDVVVEAGAGYGSETVTLARTVGPQGRVVAIEAHPETYDLLERTCTANRLTTVETVHAALTDRCGTVHISDLDPASSISNSVVTGGVLPVPAVTLDALVDTHGIERIDLLKMNVEGAEGPALEGMDRAAQRVRHAVIACHDWIADRTGAPEFRTSHAVADRLADWGFDVSRRVDDRPWVRDYLYATRRAPRTPRG